MGSDQQENKNDALATQVGGGHYKDFKIQPVEFFYANNVDSFQANVIKYIMRYKRKNGKEDLLKAKHYIDLLIECMDKYPDKKPEPKLDSFERGTVINEMLIKLDEMPVGMGFEKAFKTIEKTFKETKAKLEETK